MYKMGEVKIEFQENMLKIGTFEKCSCFRRFGNEKIRLGYIYNLGKFHLRFKKTCFFQLADENKKTAGTEICISISAAW